MFHWAQIKKITLYFNKSLIIRYVSRLRFRRSFFAISFELWWGSQGTLSFKNETIPLLETDVFHLLRLKLAYSF